MSFETQPYLVRSILDVFKKINRPITLDELSFRTRTPRNVVFTSLEKLEKAKVISSSANHQSFELNPQQSQQDISMLVK